MHSLGMPKSKGRAAIINILLFKGSSMAAMTADKNPQFSVLSSEKLPHTFALSNNYFNHLRDITVKTVLTFPPRM